MKNPDVYVDSKLKELVDKQGHREHTCAEIAKYCGMTRQAVHQIQGRALRKLAQNYYDELKLEIATPIHEGREATWYDS